MERWVLEDAAGTGPLAEVGVVLWHGAGGDIDEPSLVTVTHALSLAGAAVARARFPYRRKGKKPPDRFERLIDDANETLALLREALPRPRWIAGGRSMGGRVASALVASGVHIDGLLFLSYPLHPARRPEQLRDAHLDRVPCPMLFLSGDRDPLAQVEALQPVIARLAPRAKLELFQGANHNLRRPAEHQRAASLAVAWVSAIFGEGPTSPALGIP